MKTYILQKPLPNLNAGSELTLSCDGERYEIQEDDTKHYFSLYKEVVENNPEWFKLGAKTSGCIIGVSIKGNVVKYENSASIKLDENGEPTSIAINGKIFSSEKKLLFTLEDMRKSFEEDKNKICFQTFIESLNEIK